MKKFNLLLILFFLLATTTQAQNQINPNGYSVFRYESGQISSEGHMRDGQPDGYWKTYYTNGQLKSLGTRTNFQLDSIWVFFSENGDTTERINYKIGKKNGYYFRYAAYNDTVRVNRIIEKTLYLDDKKQGPSYNYFETGQLYQVIPYVAGKRQGQGEEFDRTGNLITLLRYNNDLLYDKEYINRFDNEKRKQGSWKTFYEDYTVKSESFYKNGLLEGMVKYYNERGKLIESQLYKEGVLVKNTALTDENVVEVRTERNPNGSIKSKGAYQGDKKIGIHAYFDAAGAIDSALQFDPTGIIIGKGAVDTLEIKQGAWEEFDSLGHVAAKGSYKNGESQGKWIFYNSKGKIIQQGSYTKGKPQGSWVWYYDNGSTRREEEYLRGFADGQSTEYDAQGNVIAKGEFLEGERNGNWIFKVGDVVIKGKYDNGLRDGEWNYFYADSTLKYKGKYVQDEPDGWHYTYYTNGKLKAEEYYIMGRREKTWRYYSIDGIPETTVLYENDKMVKMDGKKIK
jgi:antitoxin component YwqK of YwqJK toxin-antitoxin module